MIVIALSPFNPDREPVRIATAFTRTEVRGMLAGGQYAVGGSSLGLEGTDFLFLFAPDEAGAKKRIGGVFDRLDPENVSDDYRLPVVGMNEKFWVTPVRKNPSVTVHVIVFAPRGVAALTPATGGPRAGRRWQEVPTPGPELLTYRGRVFEPGALDLPEGVHSRRVSERAVSRAMRRGAVLEPGSIEMNMRACDDKPQALRWARMHSHMSPKFPPGPTDPAREVQLDMPREWLHHWGRLPAE
jgi:hypothetical protein